MESKKFSSKDSLEIISRMIAESRGKLERGGGSIFLIWGYTSVFTSILVYVLLHLTDNPQYQWFWWMIPIVGGSLMYFNMRGKPSIVKTQIDRFIGYIWLTIGLTSVLTPLCLYPVILPVEGLVLNIGVILTGAVIAFRPLIIGGIIGVILSYSLVYVSGVDQIIIFAAMFIVTMIIPGHILNFRGKCLKN